MNTLKSDLSAEQLIDLIRKMTHDLNSPLAVIQLRAEHTLELIKERPMDEAKAAKALEAILKSITRMSEIIQETRSHLTPITK